MSWLTDLVPVLSVVSTATVAIWSKILDTRSKKEDRQQAIDTKREDQKHEIDLEFNKLVGQDKRDALQPLIAATWFVKRQAQLSLKRQAQLSLPTLSDHPHAIAIRALDQYVDKLGGENVLAKLLAYSSRPVEKAVNAMLSQRDAQWQIHNTALTELGEIGREWDQIGKGVWAAPAGVAPTVTPADRLTELRRRRDEALAEIESHSTGFDVNILIEQCNAVIAAARDDFQGRGTAK